MKINDLEIIEKTATRVDAIESVIAKMIDVMTDKQKSQFQFNLVSAWKGAAAKAPANIAEKIDITREYALHIAGCQNRSE